MSFLWNKIADDGIFSSDLSVAFWSVPSARLRWGRKVRAQLRKYPVMDRGTRFGVLRQHPPGLAVVRVFCVVYFFHSKSCFNSLNVVKYGLKL